MSEYRGIGFSPMMSRVNNRRSKNKYDDEKNNEGKNCSNTYVDGEYRNVYGHHSPSLVRKK